MQIIRNHKKLALAVGGLIALAAVGVVAGAVARGAASPPPPPTSTAPGGPPPPEAYAPTITTKTAPVSAASALEQALAALAHSDILSARVGRPAADAPTSKSGAVPALDVTVRISGTTNGEDIKPLWEADLLEGVVVELAGSSHSLEDDIGSVVFNGQLPDGTIAQEIGGGIGNVARGQDFVGASDSDSTIQSAIQSTAAAYGFTVDSLKIFHALGAAPALILTVPDASQLASRYPSLVTSLFGSPPRYEGYYLEIRDPSGKPLIRTSASFVVGGSRFWSDPSVGLP